MHCLERCIVFTTEAQTQELEAGQVLGLKKGEVYFLHGNRRVIVASDDSTF